MAIDIPHRFIERLQPNSECHRLDYIIIGTFNPGLPDENKLTEHERLAYRAITDTDKFKTFCQVRNFYDRGQNRFWGLLDRIYNKDLFGKNGLEFRNPTGLKQYSTLKMNREETFERQKNFCINNGILVTDIVERVQPSSFEGIYHNFPDTAIEKAQCMWTTDSLLEVIKKFKPKKVLINFQTGKSIPRISAQINRIMDSYPGRVFKMQSTSGAAQNSYASLLNSWGVHFL